MYSRAKQVLTICLPALIAGMLLSACENDLKKVKEISQNQINMDVDTIHVVNIIFSDSARVKFTIDAPLLLQHTGKKQYNVMPKGVHINIYDKDLNQIGTLTADTGIQREDQNVIEFHKNVVARNAKGETFKSDELIWDQNTKRMHSNKQVQITMTNGDIYNGTSFESTQTLWPWTMVKSTGLFNVTDAPTQ
ncbi:LPS export ABC transporter periplasmic protein LptC [Mucilaginibacter sp. X5P1]|uniref:LPS export ABC transporter periplasmic protein LptC n=1 Tax=Mucilaginibacter sp. X5P1 TaxID=2723088 RepID=UPI002107ABA0|nr:LPS export ABC transporter periplasmic protein LptC [Mucilaginibacter sp. X5P1]